MKEKIYIWLARISFIIIGFDLFDSGSRAIIKFLGDVVSINAMMILGLIGIALVYIIPYSIILIPLGYFGFKKKSK